MGIGGSVPAETAPALIRLCLCRAWRFRLVSGTSTTPCGRLPFRSAGTAVDRSVPLGYPQSAVIAGPCGCRLPFWSAAPLAARKGGTSSAGRSPRASEVGTKRRTVLVYRPATLGVSTDGRVVAVGTVRTRQMRDLSAGPAERRSREECVSWRTMAAGRVAVG